MAKVLLTPRSFGKYSKESYELFNKNGVEVITNPTGGILKEEEMKELIKDVDAIIVGVDPLNEEVLKEAKKLKVISKYGVGTDNIDIDYCKKNNIEVTITRGANSTAVADYTFALLLGVARRLSEIDKGCHLHDWSKKVSLDVYGKKIGILGLGAIGKGVAERAEGFHMEVYGYDIYKDEEFIKNHNIHFTTIEEIMKECDFVSIHLPLTKETHHIIDRKMLKEAKDNLIIINTARGGIINEDDLYEALKSGEVYGAGIDVFENEPAADSKLLELDNVIVGSHCSASSIGAVDRMSMMATENVIKVLKERGII